MVSDIRIIIAGAHNNRGRYFSFNYGQEKKGEFSHLAGGSGIPW
jgi:hypothetical protein